MSKRTRQSAKKDDSDDGNAFVHTQLVALVEKIERDANMVGDFEASKLRLPLSSEDGRKLTWTKLARMIARKMENDPTSTDYCWLVEANNASGGSKRSEGSTGYVHMLKLTGKSDKWQTHRVMHILRNPGDWARIGNKSNADHELHVAHGCGHGRATNKGGRCCINPFHTVLVDNKVNQDHKGCKYGCAKLCPHDPKCLFTWPDTGKPKECFNDPSRYPPESCPHDRPCTHGAVQVLVLDVEEDEQ